MTIGRASYEHVGRSLGQRECLVEHAGMVLTGCAPAAMSDGRIFELRAGEIFYIPPGTTRGSEATSRTCRYTSAARPITRSRTEIRLRYCAFIRRATAWISSGVENGFIRNAVFGPRRISSTVDSVAWPLEKMTGNGCSRAIAV